MPQSRGLLVAKQLNIGKLLCALRPELNLSQQKFAADGVIPTINRWKNRRVILLLRQCSVLVPYSMSWSWAIKVKFFKQHNFRQQE
ncbi:hypothetical protein [Nostoc sp. PA-18-2419]|uniref:hypothetical protein n=1 Tax=Nostoc sp. PA-18-2419 TaxID=2575443 RepID=UPI00110985AD|nr:hypothetical protein [Nostoc sp. PA-18-2419]